MVRKRIRESRFGHPSRFANFSAPVSNLQSWLYKRNKEADVHVIEFVYDITVYTGNRDVDKNTEKLKNVF
jgi:hypothetical protein